MELHGLRGRTRAYSGVRIDEARGHGEEVHANLLGLIPAGRRPNPAEVVLLTVDLELDELVGKETLVCHKTFLVAPDDVGRRDLRARLSDEFTTLGVDVEEGWDAELLRECAVGTHPADELTVTPLLLATDVLREPLTDEREREGSPLLRRNLMEEPGEATTHLHELCLVLAQRDVETKVDVYDVADRLPVLSAAQMSVVHGAVPIHFDIADYPGLGASLALESSLMKTTSSGHGFNTWHLRKSQGFSHNQNTNPRGLVF